MKRFRFSIAVKYLILLWGVILSFQLINGSQEPNLKDFTGLGIAAAGCFIAFALIENNDVRESNKD